MYVLREKTEKELSGLVLTLWYIPHGTVGRILDVKPSGDYRKKAHPVKLWGCLQKLALLPLGENQCVESCECYGPLSPFGCEASGALTWNLMPSTQSIKDGAQGLAYWKAQKQ